MKLNLSKVVCFVGLFLLMMDMPAFAQNNHNLGVTEVQFSPVPIPVDSNGIGPMTATLAFNNLASSPADEWDGGSHPADPIELVIDLNLARLRDETDIDSNFSGLFSNYFTCTYASFANKVISCIQNADIPGSELIGYTSAGYMVIELMTTQASLQPQSNIALNINITPAAYYGDNRTEDDSAYSVAYTEEIVSASPDLLLRLRSEVSVHTLDAGAEFEAIVSVYEVGNVDTNNVIVVRLNDSVKLDFSYSANQTTSGTTAVSNSDWEYLGISSSFHQFKYSPSKIAAYGSSSFAVKWTTKQNSESEYNLTARIADGSGGETYFNNNPDTETIQATGLD